MRYVFIGLFIFAGSPFLSWVGINFFDNHFGGNWIYLGAAIGLLTPITVVILWGRSNISKYKNMFESYRTKNHLTYDIFELSDRSGFAVDLKNQFFILLPKNGAFRKVSFDDFQSIKVEKTMTGHDMIFQVKDIESPLVRVSFGGDSSQIAMARLRAAEIIS
ncbi:hypothetical protein [uncultured Pseudodesulfovibrio sp.]|uniref:hypothetical protein n=1 Tax=uncultured Pseudodesulfovibrio sp. TaxID=2035858 RepID=UPI0029C78E6C|nr:hypothetical protein [uncultured Pseudodesulfovibrio sp.]